MLTGQILSANPLVAVYDDVLTAAEIDHVLGLDHAALKRATIMDQFETKLSEQRTNRQQLIDQWSDPVLAEVCTRISSLVRLPPENCETAKLLHYRGGEKFDPHQDAFDGFMPNGAIEMMSGGQRMFTTLLYLNDVAEGGETVFPKLKISVRPKPGRVLAFSNTLPGQTERHPHAVHAGLPVTKGEKWVLSLWWRERLYHQPREYPEEEGDLRVV